MVRTMISSCLLIACAVVLVVFISVTGGKNLQAPSFSSEVYCPPESSTQCSFGCCPHPNATCCSNGFHCCEGREACGSESGKCLRLEEDGVISNKMGTPLYFPASPAGAPTPCPPCTTQCGEDKCCFFRDGTCCADGAHCCPYRYACDMEEHLCHMTVSARNEVTHRLRDNATFPLPAVTMLRALDREPYIECWGGARCPSQYAVCCEEPDYGFLTCCYLLGENHERPTVHPLMSEYDMC